MGPWPAGLEEEKIATTIINSISTGIPWDGGNQHIFKYLSCFRIRSYILSEFSIPQIIIAPCPSVCPHKKCFKTLNFGAINIYQPIFLTLSARFFLPGSSCSPNQSSALHLHCHEKRPDSARPNPTSPRSSAARWRCFGSRGTGPFFAAPARSVRRNLGRRNTWSPGSEVAGETSIKFGCWNQNLDVDRRKLLQVGHERLG